MTTSLDGVTAETMELMKGEVSKALTTGFTTATGLTGYELDAPSKKLFPVLSPFRNRLPRRKAPIGSTAAHWKVINKINAANARPSVAFGSAGTQVQTQTADYNAAYQAIALDDTVWMDAQMLAQGFEDLRATAGINLLYALMIAEDKMLLGGQNFALPVPATPVEATATTGGSLPATTQVQVAVSTRTIENYHFGGGSQRSAAGTVTTGAGATNVVTATTSAASEKLQGVVAYDWYVQYAGAGGFFYYTTTVVNAVTITTQIAADAAPPATLPLLSWTSAADNYAGRATDSSADANAYNGLLASVAADYTSGTMVTPGSGTVSGAYFKSLDGATLTGANGSVVELDNLLLSLWNTSRVSPTLLMVNSQQHIDITNKVISGGAAYTLFRPDQVGERQGLLGGALLSQYLNKAVNGRPIPIEAHPHIPPGTIVAITEALPYPSNQVSQVFEVETQQEYTQFEYAMARVAGTGGGPRYDLEVRAIEVFKNYFPAGCAVLQNIAAG